MDFLCGDVRHGASYNSEEKVKNITKILITGEKIKEHNLPTQKVLSTNVAEKENVFTVNKHEARLPLASGPMQRQEEIYIARLGTIL